MKPSLRSILILLFILLLSSPVSSEIETYRIRGGDLLSISLWDGEYMRIQRVRHDGMIHLPPYGDLSIVGLTPDRAKERIKRALEEYYPSPQVVLEVKEKSPIEVGVEGAVKNPGLYPIPYQSKVLHAITKAGGVGDDGSIEKAYLSREGYIIPLADVEGFGLKNYSLKDGDIIYIPYQNPEVFLMGEVLNPGSISYGPDLNLLQALVKVGGITWRGDERDIRILRQDGESTQYIEVNMLEIIENEAPNPLLEPGDTIIVGGKALFELTNLSFMLITVPLLLFVLLN